MYQPLLVPDRSRLKPDLLYVVILPSVKLNDTIHPLHTSPMPLLEVSMVGTP